MTLNTFLVLSLSAFAAATTDASTTEAIANGGTGSISEDQALFDSLWEEFGPQVDANGDGFVTIVEFRSMMDMLDIDEAEIVQISGEPIETTFAEYDANSDSKLSKGEVKNLANNNRHLGAAIMDKVQMKPDPSGGLDEYLNPSPMAKTASAKVVTTMTIEGSQVYQGTRKKIKMALLAAYAFDPLIISYVSSEEAGRRRQLSTATVTVTAIGFVQSTADADAAKSAIAASALSDPTTASTLLGVTVTSGAVTTSSEVTGMKSAPMAAFAFTLVFLLGPLVAMIVACVMSKSAAKKAGAEGGCTKAGCCSYYALKGAWSPMLLISCVILIIAVFMIFGAMSALSAAVGGIMDVLIEATASTGQMAEVAGAVSVEQLQQIAQLVDLLPIGAVVPGLVAAILLLIVSACGFMDPKDKGFCCTKFAIFVAYLFLCLSAAVYFLFTVMALAMYVPQVQDQIREYTILCDTVKPALKQAVDDAKTTFALAEKAGMGDDGALKSAQGMVDFADAAYPIMDHFCTMALNLISAIENLLMPAYFAFSATLFCWFNTFGACCGMGCCGKSSKKDYKVTPAA